MEEIAMLYAITDRRLYSGDEAEQRQRLLELTAVWAANGVAFILLREKDLSAREQVELARAMMYAIRQTGKNIGRSATRLLMHGRADVALAAEADGVHLPAGPDALTPGEVRSIFAAAGRTEPPFISVSCHTLLEVQAARQQAADCILFAPVFEKIVRSECSQMQRIPGIGLIQLQEACHAAVPVPVFALGGVTTENASQCLQAGAAGVAAIRLMQAPATVWRHLASS